MAANSVQFYGMSQVLEAAQNRAVANWAIFQGSQFMFKYEDGDLEGSLSMLETVLTSISHAKGIYRIQFYEDTGIKIKDKTPHDGSFNFMNKTLEEVQHENRPTLYDGQRSVILNKLEAIEARLNTMEEDPEEDEEPEGIAGIIQDPERLQGMVNAIAGIIGLAKSIINPQTPVPGAIAGIADNKRLEAAINTLSKNDPKITEHLEKLAEMSETNKATFTYLLGMLEKM